MDKTQICLSIHHVIDTWIVSILPIMDNAAMNICKQVFM